MAISGVETKCYILALFVRDDGERLLLGSGRYEFVEKQKHFSANAIQNDIIEVQGNDGYLLAGQVRRPGTQSFDGYVGDGTMSKEETEQYRRDFFAFFRKNYFYKVIYVFSDGSAIQRKRGFLVDDPTVEELYQQYPEYHVALNFEDVNYYSYSEDDDGDEIYAKSATINLSTMAATGGLVWDGLGVVWEDNQWANPVTISGNDITINNTLEVVSPLDSVTMKGDTFQQTYSGKNLLPFPYAGNSQSRGITFTDNGDGSITINGKNDGTGNSAYYLYNSGSPVPTLSTGTYYFANPGDDNIGFVSYDGSRYKDFDNSNNYSNTFTAAPRQIYIQVRTGNTTTFNNVKVWPMLTTLPNQTEADYEPYVGGIPSPNPDYPQEVQVVTGKQIITISKDGEVAQTYAVGLGDIELCKIGDYEDYIYKNGDDWYVHKEIEKVLSYGGETITTNYISTTGQLTEGATIYYGLDTASDMVVSDSTLIAQLETLETMKLWPGENNIMITATGANLVSELKFDYYTTITRTGAIWESGGSGGPTIVMVDSITNIYPIWKVTGPAVNPQLSVLSTNTTIQYNGTVTSSQTLEIDMFSKTAKLNGTSVIGNVSGEWVNFKPGNNRVVYTTNNADTPPSVIEWQEVVG